jgi:asparagine synthase (glutamine-hydrolysing)
MCGVTGIFAFNLVGKFNKVHVTAATMALEKRGPDFQDIHLDEWIALGHRRLCIIDTSPVAHQPFWDESKRYCIIFNGEIFNYRELRDQLTGQGVAFRSQSDTEVLLNLFVREKEKCLEKLNGFFAFCVYDRHEQTLFIARDRYGIKPLLYVFDDDKFIFSSEMKSIIQYGIERDLDLESLYTYFQLNYIPAPHTIYKNVKKLLPGHYAFVRKQSLTISRWYTIPFDEQNANSNEISYEEAKKRFADLLEDSVKKRLVADVPLGSFLSGGIDSSVVTGLASKHKPDLHTFSIGFRDEKFFDETDYARLVAKHFKTEHTVFSLTNDDLYSHVRNVLDHIDEPFADSSAINVYILSKQTRKYATVALSGDGADELLGGYNKHVALNRLTHPGWKELLVKNGLPVWKLFPSSRNSAFSNKVRQLRRFAEGSKLDARERYWKWAGFLEEGEVEKIFNPQTKERLNLDSFRERKENILTAIPDDPSINHALLEDMHLVLPNDMLTKVDLMSMAHGLEIRTPFLDYRVVDFVFSLRASFKVDGSMRKKILQDAFRDFLPSKLYNRPKKGFEVPLLKWFRREMKSLIVDDLLSEKFIAEQQLFHYPEIEKIKRRLFSSNPGDVHATIWALVVFQSWWKKYH